MGLSIKLSKRSQALMNAYHHLVQPQEGHLSVNKTPIDSTDLIAWLSEEHPSQGLHEKNKAKLELSLSLLRTELLRDLLCSLSLAESGTRKKKKTSWRAQAKFILFAAAGGLLAACEGFDSISTMLGVLSVPSIVIILVGLGFSLLSIVVFCSFDLIQVANELDVSVVYAPKLLDSYLEQLHEMKRLRKIINSTQLVRSTMDELRYFEKLSIMLEKRFASLIAIGVQFKSALGGKKVRIVEHIMGFIAMLLHFGSGFFAGQSVAMFVANLLMPVVVPSFWPVVLVSVLVGLAALTLYFFVARPELKRVVGRWFGLDEEKIQQLSDEDLLAKEIKKLTHLKEKIKSTKELKEQCNELACKLGAYETKESRPLELTALPNNVLFFHSVPKSLKPSKHAATTDARYQLGL